MQPKLLALIEDAILEAATEVASRAALMDVRGALNAGRVQTLLEDSLLRARLCYGVGPQLPEHGT